MMTNKTLVQNNLIIAGNDAAFLKIAVSGIVENCTFVRFKSLPWWLRLALRVVRLVDRGGDQGCQSGREKARDSLARKLGKAC